METVKIFLDTNIVLDFFSGRMGDNKAKTIVASGQDTKIELCISILTAINVLYVAGKYAPSLKASDISVLFRILTMDFQQFSDAKTLGLDDFEDALQIECAKSNGCTAIVTRDKARLNSGLHLPLILSPEEYLRKIGL